MMEGSGSNGDEDTPTVEKDKKMIDQEKKLRLIETVNEPEVVSSAVLKPSSMWDELVVSGTVIVESSALFALPTWKWDEIVGLDSVKKELGSYVLDPIKFPKEYEKFGLATSTSLLLYGPPGCGKNFLVRSLAKEAGAHYVYVKSTGLLRKTAAESELAVQMIFNFAESCSPCILFFDWVCSVAGKLCLESEDARIRGPVYGQLLVELDHIEPRRGVYVVAATDRPDILDPAVLQRGRLGRHIFVPFPSPAERGMILCALFRRAGIEVHADLITLGRSDGCKNFSGADLNYLMQEVVLIAKEERSVVTDAHFIKALMKVSRSVRDEQIEVCRVFSTS